MVQFQQFVITIHKIKFGFGSEISMTTFCEPRVQYNYRIRLRDICSKF